mmetsp:Transcript_22807/g.31865  ORF Transcript_22807/g.31865 Transcript_22807/m.31865 type:complete len:214 (+) Transcript_22807:253-894(+)
MLCGGRRRWVSSKQPHQIHSSSAATTPRVQSCGRRLARLRLSTMPHRESSEWIGQIFRAFLLTRWRSHDLSPLRRRRRSKRGFEGRELRLWRGGGGGDSWRVAGDGSDWRWREGRRPPHRRDSGAIRGRSEVEKLRGCSDEALCLFFLGLLGGGFGRRLVGFVAFFFVFFFVFGLSRLLRVLVGLLSGPHRLSCSLVTFVFAPNFSLRLPRFF